MRKLYLCYIAASLIEDHAYQIGFGLWDVLVSIEDRLWIFIAEYQFESPDVRGRE